MSIGDLSKLVEAAIRSEAGQLLAGDRATLQATELGESPLVVLGPLQAEAAPLEVSIDTERQVTCFPGRSGMSYEIYSKNLDEIEGCVSGLARAVIAGEYSERVNDAGARTKIVAEWKEGERITAPRLNVIRTPRPDAEGWRTVRYAPY